MTIWVDDRSGSRELVDYPPLDTAGTLCRLEAADVLFPGHGPDGRTLIGVEVKTVPDLIQSADSGRLQDTQIRQMVDRYDEVWLGLYGPFRRGPGGELQVQRRRGKEGPRRGRPRRRHPGPSWSTVRAGSRVFMWSYLMRLLCTLSAIGVRPWWVPDRGAMARWLGELYAWHSKPWEGHRALQTLDRSGVRARRSGSQDQRRRATLLPHVPADARRRAGVAMALVEGVGYHRALAAAERFGSVREMVEATEEEWAEVPGIGEVLAAALVRAVG